MKNPTVLIVQNGVSEAARVEAMLKARHCAVCDVVSPGTGAMDRIEGSQPDLALVDLVSGEEADGVEAAREIGRRFDVPVVFMVDEADEETLSRTAEADPSGYVLKPVVEGQLHLTMKTALSFRERQRECSAKESRLKRKVDETRNRNRVLENILDSISDAVVAIDGKGDYLVFNSSAKRLFGPPVHGSALDQRSEKYGLFLPDRVSPFPDRDLPLSRALSGVHEDDVEIFVSGSNAASENLISVSARPLLNDERQVIGAVCISRDIGSQKEQEDTLDQTVSELTGQVKLLESVLDRVNDAVLLSDGTNRILYMNRKARQVRGMDPEAGIPDTPLTERSALFGIHFADGKTLVPPHQLPLVRAVRGEETPDSVLLVRNVDNTEGTYCDVRGMPILDDGGVSVKCGLVVARDIDECRKAVSRWERAVGAQDGPVPEEVATEAGIDVAYAAAEAAAPPDGNRMPAETSEEEQVIARLYDQTQLLESIFDNMSDGIVVVDTTGKILFANRVMERIFGEWIVNPDPEDWSVGFGVYYPGLKTLVPVDQLPLTRALHGEETEETEYFVRNRKNTEGTYIKARGIPIRSGQAEEVVAALTIVKDVTEERESEERLSRVNAELREQTTLMQTVIESMNEGLVVVDTSGRVLFNNSSAEEIFGMKELDVPPTEWVTAYGIYYPDQKTRPPVEAIPLVRAIGGEPAAAMEGFVRNEYRPEGIHISAEAHPLLAGDGRQVIGAVGIIRDITSQKLAEARLNDAIRELDTKNHLNEVIFDSVSDGLIVADKEGKFTIFNESAERIVGIGMVDLPPESWTEEYGIFYLDQVTRVPVEQIPLVRAISGEEVNEVELFLRNEKRPEGVYVSVDGRPLLDDVKGHAGGVVVFRDITERKRAEEELNRTVQNLREHDELMETTFNSISDGIVVADEKGEFLYVNPAASRIVGMGPTETSPDEWSSTYGTFHTDRETPFDSEDLPLVRAIFKLESTDDVDLFIRNEQRPDGVFIRVSGRPLLDEVGGVRGGVITFRDVTEQVLSEEALSRAFVQGRMEVVDTILHNIGNAVNSITVGIDTLDRTLTNDRLVNRFQSLAGALEAHREDWASYISNDAQGQKAIPFILALAEDMSRQREQLAQTVERVRDRANHVADIVRSQKDLGSTGMDRKDINLKNALAVAVRVLQDSAIKRNVAIDIDCGDAPDEIRVQESQFHQMVVNLVKNALESIDELTASGGLEEDARVRIRARPEGEFLCLEVSDNGIGIEESNIDRLFTAGYTTKASGSGLGLHSVANFVIGQGGKLEPHSDGIGKGATIRVLLRGTIATPPPPPPQKIRGMATGRVADFGYPFESAHPDRRRSAGNPRGLSRNAEALRGHGADGPAGPGLRRRGGSGLPARLRIAPRPQRRGSGGDGPVGTGGGPPDRRGLRGRPDASRHRRRRNDPPDPEDGYRAGDRHHDGVYGQAAVRNRPGYGDVAQAALHPEAVFAGGDPADHPLPDRQVERRTFPG